MSNFESLPSAPPPRELGDIQIAVGDRHADSATPVVRSSDWWRHRHRDYLQDRRNVCRVIGIAMWVIAVVNVIPPYVHWREWLGDWAAAPLPRWIFLQVFVSGWIAMYAVFVWQVCHWTALRATVVAMGLVSIAWAVVAAGLKFGAPRTGWAAWLQLPVSHVERGSLWCLAMLCLCLIAVYLCGRESQRWRKVETLLQRVVAD